MWMDLSQEEKKKKMEVGGCALKERIEMKRSTKVARRRESER